MKIRLLGLVPFGVGISATAWLYRLVHNLPYRQDGLEHMLLAAVAFLCLTTGVALLALGPNLFGRDEMPRH